jgi:integrase
MLSSAVSPPPPPPPTLPPRFRLFCGDPNSAAEEPLQSPSGPSLDWTIRQFFEGFVLPRYLVAKNRQPGTIKLYRQVVDLWEELTPNPSLRSIEQDDDLCRDFVEALKRRPGLKKKSKVAPNTVRKLCVHFQKILDLAGPKNRRNRSPARLMGESPYVERPEAVHTPPDGDFTLDEIGMWLGVCDRARNAKNLGGLDPQKFHSALILFCYNTGFRIDTVMSASWDMIGRTKTDWITIPPQIYKGRKWGGDFYLNRHARAAIESIRTRKSNLLFPWRGWPSSQSWLQESRREILALTNIRPHRRFGFHGLRNSLGTWLAAKNPMVSSIVLGHRMGETAGFSATTRDFYVNPDIVVEWLEQVPQPRRLKPSPQKLLF